MNSLPEQRSFLIVDFGRIVVIIVNMQLDGVIDNEDILPDNYPVYWGYAYVCDGKVRLSPIKGDVLALKFELGVKEVRRCNLVGRGIY